MAERHGEGSIAPRRSLEGPILPPPPPEIAEEAARKEEEEAAKRAKKEQAEAKKREAQAEQQAKKREAQAEQEAKKIAAKRAATKKTTAKKRPAPAPDTASSPGVDVEPTSAAVPAPGGTTTSPTALMAVGTRRRRARLRLTQVDAWSVMKTAFLLSIALGIVLVVAVAVIWSVLGSAGVWDSINSTVQQAVGTDNGDSFDIEDYLGTSRVVGFAMIVAVLDVILITAIATLGAFLYNLAAALVGGIEVTLSEGK